jgi:hypothetical protein
VLKCSFSLFSTLSTVSVIEILVLDTSIFCTGPANIFGKKNLVQSLIYTK